MTKKVLRSALELAVGQEKEFLVYGVLHEGSKKRISKFCDYTGLIKMLNMSFELGVLDNLRAWESNGKNYRLMKDLELKTISKIRYIESSNSILEKSI